MKNHFSRRRSADRRKRDENTMRNQNRSITERSTLTRDNLVMNKIKHYKRKTAQTRLRCTNDEK